MTPLGVSRRTMSPCSTRRAWQSRTWRSRSPRCSVVTNPTCRRSTSRPRAFRLARMTEAENKALIAKFYEEVWAKGHLAVADEVFAPDYVRHDLRPTDALPGPEGQKKIAADFRSAFPDLQFEVELLLADGDYVAGRWTGSGTHLGSWG